MTVRKYGRPGLASLMLEAGLWLSAAGCVACCAVVGVRAHAAQHSAEEVEVRPAPAESDAGSSGLARPGRLLGRLELAGAGLSVPMLESCDPATLRRGVGHVPGTAVPGGLGNLVLAGHRDTFFRPLRRAQPGMEADVITPRGRWRYHIDRTEVVNPEQVDVLLSGDVPGMTLITCFPFDYIGAAPRRFIVHAHLVSVDPD